MTSTMTATFVLKGQVLKYSTTTKEGKRQNKSKPTQCATCPLLTRCTNNKDHRKIIERHIWAHHVEEANHLRHQNEIKQIYARRKETIKRLKKSMVCAGQP